MATMLDKTRDEPQNEAKAPAPPPQAERAAPLVEPPKDDPKAKSGGIVGTLKAHPLLAGLVLLALVVAALGGWFYWMYASQFESTDDAFIDGRVVSISPEVVGDITLVPVTDNQVVHAGDLLARIDRAAVGFGLRGQTRGAALRPRHAHRRLAPDRRDPCATQERRGAESGG
jgi:hypothetical protein